MKVLLVDEDETMFILAEDDFDPNDWLAKVIIYDERRKRLSQKLYLNSILNNDPDFYFEPELEYTAEDVEKMLRCEY